MGRHPATQRRLQFRRGGLQAPVRRCFQGLWIGSAGDQGLDHATAGDANDIADHRIELDVGILQRLLDALGILGMATFDHLPRLSVHS